MNLLSLASTGNPMRAMPDNSSARCREDPDAWFAFSERAHAVAKLACGACPLLEPCRVYSIALMQNKAQAPSWGVWAGMTTPELRKAAGVGRRRRRVIDVY